MALNAAERAAAARSVLECFGESTEWTGRFLAYLQVRGGISLLADVVTQSNSWQPFISAGLSIVWWQGEVTRHRDLTLAQIS